MEENKNIDEKLRLNIRKIFRGQLALEDYSDLRGENPDIISQMMKKIGDYRKIKPTLTKEQLLELTNNLCEMLEQTYTTLGKEHFTFYDDGDVLYKG